ALEAADKAQALLAPAASVLALVRLSRAAELAGLAAARLERSELAAKKLEKSLQLAESAVATAPHDSAVQTNWAMALQNMGDIESKRNRFGNAEQHYRKALELRERSVETGGPSESTQLALALIHNRLGDVELRMKRYDEALKTIDLAIALLEP